MTIPISKASPSSAGSSIRGDVGVIRFQRVISHTFNQAHASVVHQRAVAVAATVDAAAFSGTQADCPRNVLVVDNGAAGGNSGDVVINGLDQYGEATAETIAINNLATATGVTPFTRISSIEFPEVTDTNIEIQLGSRIGIIGDLYRGNLYAVAHDAGGGGAKAFVDPAAFTLDEEHDTVIDTGSNIAADDVYEYYFKG